jgi:hypothetical protein
LSEASVAGWAARLGRRLTRQFYEMRGNLVVMAAFAAACAIGYAAATGLSEFR